MRYFWFKDIKYHILSSPSVNFLLVNQTGTDRDRPEQIGPVHTIAFEHLGIYIKNHLSQSVVISDKVVHGRPRQSQVQPGKAGCTARYDQVQPGIVLKRPIMCYIFENQELRGY